MFIFVKLILKRTVAQILILLLILPIGLTSGYLKWQQRMVKQEVKSKLLCNLDDTDLTRLSFHKQGVSSLNWKDIHEFSYGGEMYDVVRIETLKDSVIYWCWHDVKESIIEQQLYSLYKATFFSKPHSQRASHHLWNYLMTLFFDFPSSIKAISLNYLQDLGNSVFAYLPQIYVTTPSPPPRIC